ncbi:hypothetical protein PMAYCL1PPCAC_30127, partial [Pristionchus mayeri]
FQSLPSMPHLMGIDLAPLNVPLERRLQTMGVIYHFTFAFLAPFLTFLFFFWLAYSGYMLVVAAYVVWLWWDWDSPKQGLTQLHIVHTPPTIYVTSVCTSGSVDSSHSNSMQQHRYLITRITSLVFTRTVSSPFLHTTSSETERE